MRYTVVDRLLELFAKRCESDTFSKELGPLGFDHELFTVGG